MLLTGGCMLYNIVKWDPRLTFPATFPSLTMPSLVPGPVSSTSSSSRLSFPSLTLSCITSARLCWTGLTPGGCLSDSQGWWWCCSCPEQMVTTDYTEYCWVLTISSHRWFSPTPVLYSALVHPVLYTTGGDNNTITRASSAYCSVTALSSTMSVNTTFLKERTKLLSTLLRFCHERGDWTLWFPATLLYSDRYS